MKKRYGHTCPNAIEDPLELSILAEYESLPVVKTLDDYGHFYDQLKAMRARSTEYIPARFAMEFALLLRLNEYDEKIGMPPCEMPLGNGNGGLVDFSPVPAAWLSDR